MKQKDEFFQFGTTIILDPDEDIGVLLDEGPQWWLPHPDKLRGGPTSRFA